jgi:two-component sensor histidine kinase
VLLELRYATLVTLGSLIVAVTLFMHWGDPTVARVFLLAAYLVTAGLIMAVGCSLRRMIIDLDFQSRQFELFNAELQHRLKNTLQMICAMASSGRRNGDPAQFYADLTSRVQTINRANEFLGITQYQHGGMHDVVQLAIRPFRSEAFQISGPPSMVGGETALRLMMALHELCTNATKYGALSAPQGRVTIDWNATGNGLIALEWKEHGGPPVTPPACRGLGSHLLVNKAPLDKVELDFRPDGVRCRFEFGAAPSQKAA